ncbi:MAG: invasion associated locus B family protein [Aquamicrobium sp.]|jgi:invasion protein IalB|uniref:invasion associated locus B family protein n=1 Tax=Aquamicrobium sp. TaxID=1872579 RepID=UPI00349E973D|nr:invasion associated locus B family protein [Aquamicrobium sp.]MCO5158257.1 invasion associated locus B family protein [Aquamicrobium sp.]
MQLSTNAIRSVAVVAMMSTGPALAQGLPGGASSLNEKHGDWTVACAMREEAIRCVMSQTQVRGENRQRVLAIELTAAEGGQAASGTLVLPFGLNLDQGAVLSIDEGEFLPALRFSTCLPAGCLVPLTFNPDAVTAMRAGTALKVKAAANDSGQEVNFSISLSGFSSALARAAELTTP